VRRRFARHVPALHTPVASSGVDGLHVALANSRERRRGYDERRL